MDNTSLVTPKYKFTEYNQSSPKYHNIKSLWETCISFEIGYACMPYQFEQNVIPKATLSEFENLTSRSEKKAILTYLVETLHNIFYKKESFPTSLETVLKENSNEINQDHDLSQVFSDISTQSTRLW